MIELIKLEDLEQLGKAIMNQEHPLELYLTECDYCCSHNASYRLFTKVPEFKEVKGTLHPDTGPNIEIMVARTYNQDIDLIDKIARTISTQVRDIAGQGDIPIKAKIRKLK